MNALIATVIVVGAPDRVDEAAEALQHLDDAGGVRAVLISEGKRSETPADSSETTIRLDGLAPKYVDNAVAWLRLSSLPAVVWWRGGPSLALDRLAHLADRLVLDTDPPDEMWARAPRLFERTALTDLRWSALTRWRAALAHVFDLPQVREDAARIERLEIDASDRASARLYAGWLRSSLKWNGKVAVEIRDSPGEAGMLSCVHLAGGALDIALHVREGRTCLRADVNGQTARVVPLGEGTLSSRFAEELSVRTRDGAFERALVAAMEIPE